MSARAGRRVASILALVTAGTLLLSGCQTPPDVDSDSGPGCAPEGVASLSVSAQGELFSRPEVTFPAPISPLTTERSVLVAGDGPAVTPDSIVTVDFVAFNGASGEPIEATGYGAPGIGRTLITLDGESAMPGVRRALLCSTVGSRIAAVVHPEDGIGAQGAAVGVASGESIVYVFDIVSIALDRADGEEQPQDPALPLVEATGDSPPIATMPPTPPPTQLVTTTILTGDGPAVRDGSDLVIRYRAMLWRNGLTVFENWSVPSLERTSMTDLLPGVAQSLVGTTVGSRVMAIVPPDLGFGRDGDAQSSVTGTDTLVYVVDILATT
jgi:FKBP-type peptidyl-prolyl cis-trans isomerase